MSIDSTSFFTSCLRIVDNVIGGFVDHVFHSLISQYSGVITLCFTLYVILIGYRFVTHTISADIMTITKQLILMLIVYGLVMNFNLYNKLVYNVFTQEPLNIAQVVIKGAAEGSGVVTVHIDSALDEFYYVGMSIAQNFFGAVSFTKLAPLFYAAGVWIVTMILCVTALLLFIYSKMAMAIGLALAPIFLISMLWDSTRGLFSAWLNKLINFALVPIVTSSILSLMLSVAHETLPQKDIPFEQQDLFGIAAFMVLSLATVGLLSRVFNICSALAGSGITLGGISEGMSSYSLGKRQGRSHTPRGGVRQPEPEGKEPSKDKDDKERVRNNRNDKR